MFVFRRSSSAGATDDKVQDSQPKQGAGTGGAQAKTRPPAETGKGRPTRKRSEAEANRYRTVTGATTSGRGRQPAPARGGKRTPEDKARARGERARQAEAQRRGEEWALGPRDKGPVKRMVRDYVDAHRRPSEFYMYALVILVIALFADRSSSALGAYMQLLLIAIVAVIMVDGFFIRRSVLRLARERFPGESTRGLAYYAIMRALQLRRFRSPAPRLKPGDKF